MVRRRRGKKNKFAIRIQKLTEESIEKSLREIEKAFGKIFGGTGEEYNAEVKRSFDEGK